MKIWLASLTVLLSISIIGLSVDMAFAQFSPNQGSAIVTKSVDKSIIVSGTTVKFTIDFENNGPSTFLNCALNDDFLGPLALPADKIVLSPGETGQVMVSVPVFATFTNTATLTCNVDGEDPQSFTGSATVTVVNPQTTVDKSVSKTQVIDGQSVTYNISVFNVGDIDLEFCT